jgi:hypothetical protein
MELSEKGITPKIAITGIATKMICKETCSPMESNSSHIDAQEIKMNIWEYRSAIRIALRLLNASSSFRTDKILATIPLSVVLFDSVFGILNVNISKPDAVVPAIRIIMKTVYCPNISNFWVTTNPTTAAVANTIAERKPNPRSISIEDRIFLFDVEVLYKAAKRYASPPNEVGRKLFKYAPIQEISNPFLKLIGNP